MCYPPEITDPYHPCYQVNRSYQDYCKAVDHYQKGYQPSSSQLWYQKAEPQWRTVCQMFRQLEQDYEQLLQQGYSVYFTYQPLMGKYPYGYYKGRKQQRL